MSKIIYQITRLLIWMLSGSIIRREEGTAHNDLWRALIRFGNRYRAGIKWKKDENNL